MRAARRVTAVAATGAALVLVAGVANAQAATAGWTQTGSSLHNTLDAGEGVATNGGSVILRGMAGIPLSVAAEGWTHIGDPDAAQGYVFDAYQSGASTPTSKMYRVTAPSGAAYEYVHNLAPGELYNNSFDAVSPDTQWMVSGEWGTMDHLQVYPTPILNKATSPTGGSLDLSGLIHLDHAVDNVQGCDFTSPTQLLCASDDSSKSLFPDDKPLLQVDLPAPLSGGDTTGHVTDLGPIPQSSACSGDGETEGVDYDPATGVLRLEMIQPGVCKVVTSVDTFQRG